MKTMKKTNRHSEHKGAMKKRGYSIFLGSLMN